MARLPFQHESLSVPLSAAVLLNWVLWQDDTIPRSTAMHDKRREDCPQQIRLKPHTIGDEGAGQPALVPARLNVLEAWAEPSPTRLLQLGGILGRCVGVEVGVGRYARHEGELVTKSPELPLAHGAGQPSTHADVSYSHEK